jgi:pimeloyl-ACP methyl ester carboxylesterase
VAEGKRAGGGLGKALLAGTALIAGAVMVRGAIQRQARAKAYLGEGIDEKGFMTLGGIPQWVTVRGRDLDNPLLLVLHGGPGFAMSQSRLRAFPGWDERFTVVNWDQRGAGRTFGRNRKAGSGELTLGRFVVDGVELAQELKRRFPGRPLILLGWSWGSVIGVEMIRARPDLFAAYVGTGQVVDMERGEQLSYFGAIDRLRAKGDERGAQALEAIGPPPYPNTKALIKQRQLLISTMPKAERRLMRDLVADLVFAPDARLTDLPDYFAGLRFSLESLWKPLQGWRLADGGVEFDVPMVFIEGDLDLQVPSTLVTALVPTLKASSVELVTIEGGAHTALTTHPDAFRKALLERVRPLVVGKGEDRRRVPKARRTSGSSRPSGRPRG